MMTGYRTPHISEAMRKELASYDTCAVANAIESFNLRLRNEGFTKDSLRCRFPDLPPIVGYAVTIRVHSSNPPMEGGAYEQRSDWWDQIEDVPAPRVLVIQDADRHPGVGAFVGEIHAAIMQALHCIGVVTNGAVRDLPAVKQTGFQMFSSSVSVSHAYMHVVEVNKPVEVGGLRVDAGDLLHGDQHGVVSVPAQIVPNLPEMLARIRSKERRILAYCRSSSFSRDGLRNFLGDSV